MKKFCLFLGLISISLMALPEISLAKKKYRYIKREHGARFQMDIPATIHPGSEADLSFKGVYTYNWKGRIEVGPYVSLNSSILPAFHVGDYSGGVLAEYNIVKNRGKIKFIPSVGMKIGAISQYSETKLGMGLHASIKYFVAKRTPFITTLEYMTSVPFNFNFSGLSHHINISTGFAYYFDFY